MRILFILMVVPFLSRCPSFLTAVVKNDSATQIEILRFMQSESGEVILAAEKAKVGWSRDCQTIVLGKNRKGFLRTLELPEDTYELIGNRETRLRVQYDGDSFFYIDSKGKKYMISEATSC